MTFLDKWTKYQEDKTIEGSTFQIRELKELLKTKLTYQQAEIISHIQKKQELLLLIGMAGYLFIGVALGYIMAYKP